VTENTVTLQVAFKDRLPNLEDCIGSGSCPAMDTQASAGDGGVWNGSVDSRLSSTLDHAGMMYGNMGISSLVDLTMDHV
jgi:hypothetical protein